MSRMPGLLATVLLLATVAPAEPVAAQQVDPALLRALQWRGIATITGGSAP